MYMIKWTENNTVKTQAVFSWIERDAIMEELTEKQFNPSYELI